MPGADPALVDRSSEELAALLVQAQQGDSEAFGYLCSVLKPRLLRQAILLGGEVSLAEDLVQETLVEAWRSLGRFNGRCQFFTWLCAILHNRYRNATRRKRLFLYFGLGRANSDESCGFPDPPDLDAWPDEAAQSREQADLVRRCVQALPMKQQQVIYLRFFVDDSLEGIAAALQCSVGTVKSRLFHALEKLRSMPALQRQHGSIPSPANVL